MGENYNYYERVNIKGCTFWGNGIHNSQQVVKGMYLRQRGPGKCLWTGRHWYRKEDQDLDSLP